MLQSYFGPNAVSPSTSGLSTAVTPATVVELAKEIAQIRQDNLAFRRSVADHEAAELAKLTTETTSKSRGLQQAGSSRGGRGGNGKMVPSNKADLRIRPPSLRVPARVPKNLNSRIVFDVVKIRGTLATSMSAITETNFTFYLGLHPQASSWSALYDQWAVVQGSVTFYSQEAPGSTATVAELHTAIDFDNNGALGSLISLDDYGSSQVDMLVFNKSVTRSCRPCLKLQNTSAANAIVSRQWCDSGTPNSTLWFGIRSIFATAVTAVNAITTETTIVFAFRNSI
jgi:hypothetical protein